MQYGCRNTLLDPEVSSTLVVMPEDILQRQNKEHLEGLALDLLPRASKDRVVYRPSIDSFFLDSPRSVRADVGARGLLPHSWARFGLIAARCMTDFRQYCHYCEIQYQG